MTVTPHGRAYAVREAGELVVVAVYLAGARAVAERIAGPDGYEDQTPSGIRRARTARLPRPIPPPIVHPAPLCLTA